jgi:quercetin dioxygenase-like cupin family protein
MDFTYFESLPDLLTEVPDDSIVSRSVYDGPDAKVILFAFAAGQELSEHTAARPAVLHFLSGEAALTLGSDQMDARPGTWVRMPAHLPHSVSARTEVTMLLVLLNEATPEAGAE